MTKKITTVSQKKKEEKWSEKAKSIVTLVCSEKGCQWPEPIVDSYIEHVLFLTGLFFGFR